MVSHPPKFLIYPISEKAVSVEFGNKIEEEIRQKISTLNQAILLEPFKGFLTTVPAYTTLTIFFEPIILLKDHSIKGHTCLEKISFYLTKITTNLDHQTQKENNIIHIPVCYDDAFGLDLRELSTSHQLSKKQIIELHSSVIYSVFMIGFVPGFPYLGGLNERLNTPRKGIPRKLIPAGSVGIAGLQTGIYPLETPGGWQIIGRTPLQLFDVNRTQPSLLKAGDYVKFVPISTQDFYSYPKN